MHTCFIAYAVLCVLGGAGFLALQRGTNLLIGNTKMPPNLKQWLIFAAISVVLLAGSFWQNTAGNMAMSTDRRAAVAVAPSLPTFEDWVNKAPPEPCSLHNEASTLAVVNMYLDLVHRSIRHFLYEGPTVGEDEPLEALAMQEWVTSVSSSGYLLEAHTLVCLNCITLLHAALEYVIKARVKGALVETGVYRGGVIVYMQAFLQAHGLLAEACGRAVWAVDSFEGIPPPRKAQHEAAWAGTHAAGLDVVRSTVARYGLLAPNLHFLKGFFADTLPDADFGGPLALLRFDGDTYDSTLDVLTHAYPRLVRFGIFIIDDWHLGGCRDALFEYRGLNGITDTIFQITGHVVSDGMMKPVQKNAYWIKGSGPNQHGADCILDSSLCSVVPD